MEREREKNRSIEWVNNDGNGGDWKATTEKPKVHNVQKHIHYLSSSYF